MRSIPVVVPGIMGSTLATGPGPQSHFLWSDDFRKNYATLVESSGSLQWSGNRAYAKLLNQVVFTVPVLNLPLVKFDLWSRSLRWIANHPRLDGALLIEFGYDWRAPLDDTAIEFALRLGGAVGCDIRASRPRDISDFIFFMHSMGGVLVQLALGSGLIHPSWIGALVFIGTPHKGSPSAFRSVYDSLSLPLFQDIFGFIKGRNRIVFLNHLLECIRTFPSIYSLFPPNEILYLYYSSSSRSNPLLEDVMPPECAQRARRTHTLMNEATKYIMQHSIQSYAVYTAVNEDHRTELEYRVTPVPHQRAYQIQEMVSSTMQGDGTVPADSARGNVPPFHPMTVTNVSHDVMCNSPRVIEILDALFAEVAEVPEVSKDDSSLQHR